MPQNKRNVYIDDLVQELADLIAKCEPNYIKKLFNKISPNERVFDYMGDGFFIVGTEDD